MKRFIYILILLTAILLFTNCAANKPDTYEDYNIYYKEAKENFDKEKWLKAIDDFRLYILNKPGGELADDAQFYIGECYYNREEYLLAIAEYNQLVERYKYSDLLVDGYFKIAMAYYELSPKYQRDQTNTEKALRQLQEFIDAFPNTQKAKLAQDKIDELRNKLGRKLYESGKIYRKMGYWNAALLYQNDMLNQYYDSEYAIYAKYEKAYCNIKKRDFKAYNEMKADIEQSEQLEKEEKDKMLNKLSKNYNKEMREIEREKRKAKDKERRKSWWF